MESEQPALLTKEEFIQKFKYEHQLLHTDRSILESWETYVKAITQLRSDSIKYLKLLGMPGWRRAEYNDALQKLCKYGYKEYLFYKDPTCGICSRPIYKIEEVTIDHIHPLSKGGPNLMSNKQIAHAKCNVKKSDKVGYKPR